MNIRFFADYAVEQLSHPDFETRGHRNHVSWDPAGVTAIITPWNAPLMLATWRIGPALAAGNTVVAEAAGVGAAHRVAASPTSRTRPGCPPASSTSCRASAPRRARRSSRNPDVRAHLLHRVGADRARSSARAAAATSPRCSFELGGKSPSVVFDDADLDLAVDLADRAVRQRRPGLPGRPSACSSRTASPTRSARGSSRARRDRSVRATRATRPRDIGPLIQPASTSSGSEGFVDRARSRTAPRSSSAASRSTTRPRRPLLPAHRSFEGAQPGSEILTPGGVRPGPDAADVRHRGGGPSRWPTTPSTAWPPRVVTGDRERAERCHAALVAGTVWVNCFFVRDLVAPVRRATAVRASAARAAPGPSTSTADVKNTVYAPNGWNGTDHG